MSDHVSVDHVSAHERLCRATTADGRPCRNHRLNADGLCWRHDGRSQPELHSRVATTEPKVCRTCRHERPARAFRVGPTNPKTGIAYRVGTCRACEEAARRRAGTPKRHQRRNARGDVWCNNCARYLDPSRFRRHPSRPHTYWSYCIECTRALDRLRARATPGTEAWRADIDRRVAQRRQQRAKDARERTRFVKEAIALLRRRGLTKTEICRLAGVSYGNLLIWERGDRRPDPNVAARFGELLRETSELPLRATPEARRRRPHPRLPELLERMRPHLERLPVRSRWKPA